MDCVPDICLPGWSGDVRELSGLVHLETLNLGDCRKLTGECGLVVRLEHGVSRWRVLRGGRLCLFPGHYISLLPFLPKLTKLYTDDCGVHGADYAQELRQLVAAAHVEGADPPRRELEVFLSKYSVWRASEEATTGVKPAMYNGGLTFDHWKSEDVDPSGATEEECGWFKGLFGVLINTAKMDKEWLLLCSASHSLLGAVSVLLDHYGATGTAPVEDDAQHRIVSNMTGLAPEALQRRISGLGAYLGRFKILKEIHRSATALVVLAVDTQATDQAKISVVIKFMKDLQQCEREVAARRGLESDWVVGVEMTSEELGTEAFAAEAIRLGYYPYGIVMVAGERNLQVPSPRRAVLSPLALY